MPVCSQCGGTDIEIDASRGDAVCIQCGNVLEENTIVNEVTFAQDAGGGSSVVGQFVSATPGRNVGLGFNRESREVAFANGQRHISQLAAALRLADHHQEAANRLFHLAVQHNFIQGRKTQHVIAACLYTVCRREKTAHLLIDYSDVLQTNVYLLGSCFLKFTRILSLTLPIIDPSLYIHRFASKLEFGDRTHLVSMSALRLVQRMKRDWIQTGRRPSGICGAALLIAARVHGFRRTQREVVRVVRICDVTLRKRLDEFSDTAVGVLTAQQLETIDLQNYGVAADPPSFSRNRRLEAEQRRMLMAPEQEAARQRREEEARSLKVAELRTRLAELGLSSAGRKPELLARLLEYLSRESLEIEEGATGDADATGDTALLRTTDGAASSAPTDSLDAEMQQALQSDVLVALGGGGDGDGSGDGCGLGEGAGGGVDGGAGGGPVDGRQAHARAASAAASVGSGDDAGDFEPVDRDGGYGAEGASSAWAAVDLVASRDEEELGEEEQQVLMDELNADLEGLDPEVDCYLITDSAEVARKERLWEDLNKDYLEQKAARMAARERDGDEADGDGRVRSKKKRRNGGAQSQPGSAAEAVEGELRRNRQLSNRINYDVINLLSRILPEDAPLMPDGPDGVDGEHAADQIPEAFAVDANDELADEGPCVEEY